MKLGDICFVLCAGVLATGCSSVDQASDDLPDASADDIVEAAPQPDGAQADGEALDSASGEFWDGLVWEGLSPGDAVGDCQALDQGCDADIQDLYYSVGTDAAFFKLEFAGAFPAQSGSLEVFMMPVAQPLVGYSVQVAAGDVRVWKADCTTAAPAAADLRHSGCHWSDLQASDGFETAWADEASFVFRLPLSMVPSDETGTLLVGAGAAPFAIEKTAEYTDRLPDEVWVTATSIQGLTTIQLPAR